MHKPRRYNVVVSYSNKQDKTIFIRDLDKTNIVHSRTGAKLFSFVIGNRTKNIVILAEKLNIKTEQCFC